MFPNQIKMFFSFLDLQLIDCFLSEAVLDSENNLIMILKKVRAAKRVAEIKYLKQRIECVEELLQNPDL